MKLYRNSKTSTKLMLGFGMMAILMCILGYAGVRSVGEVNDATLSLYEQHAMGLSHLKDANIHMLSASRGVRNYILARNEAEATAKLDKIHEDRAAFAAEFATFQHLLVQESAKARAITMLQDYDKMAAEWDKVIALAKSHQRERAVEGLTEVSKWNAVVDKGFAELSQVKMDSMKQSVEQAETTYRSSRLTSISLVAVAVLAALLIGWFISNLVSRAIAETSTVLAAVAAGNLTARMEGAHEGDFALIKNSLNLAVSKLQDAMSEVREAAEHVADTARTLSSGSEEMASGAQEQASSLEETASSLEEITSTVKQNADNARQASQLAAGSRDAAEKGGSVVRAAVTAMSEINASSTRIAEIITTIDEIAFQTNLLALNAAVEAARAGEQGRGFAVVAAEVRNLAQRSATASKEIKALIQDSVRKVENGSDLVNRSGQTLDEIVQSVKRVTDIVAEIAAASQEQSTGIEQVNKATMQMDQVTQANAAQTEEMSSTAQGLSASAEQLQGMVGRFQLGTAVKVRAAAPAAPKPPARRPAAPRAKRYQNDHAVESLAGLATHTGSDFEEF